MGDEEKHKQLLYIRYFSLINTIMAKRFKVNELIKNMRDGDSKPSLKRWQKLIDNNDNNPWVCVFGPEYIYFNQRAQDIEHIAQSNIFVDISKYKAFFNGHEQLLRRIEIYKIMICLCMDYWSKNEDKRNTSIIALIKNEVSHSIFKEKHSGVQAMLCWNTLDKGLKEMFFTLFFNNLAIWHVNPIDNKRSDFENIKLFKV